MRHKTIVGTEDGPVTIEVTLADDLDQAIAAYGQETVFHLFQQKALASANRAAKRMLDRGEIKEAVQFRINFWKPASRAARIRLAAKEAVRKAVVALPKDAQAEVLNSVGKQALLAASKLWGEGEEL